MSNKVRKITIGTDITKSMNYVVGGIQKLFVDKTPIVKTISEIEEKEDCFEIYLGENGESQLWKRLPKNNETYVEYVID